MFTDEHYLCGFRAIEGESEAKNRPHFKEGYSGLTSTGITVNKAR